MRAAAWFRTEFRLALRRQPALSLLVGYTVLDSLLHTLSRHYLVSWPIAFWTVDVTTFVLIPLAFLIVAIRTGEASLDELGFRGTTVYEHGRRDLVILLLTTPIVTPVLFIMMQGVGQCLLPVGNPFTSLLWSYQAVLPTPGIWRLVVVLYWSVSAGVVEEFTFRAALYHVLPRRQAEGVSYIAISALLFALVHWWQGPSSMIDKALFGAFMAVLYRTPRNIWPPIIGHAATDLLWFSVWLSRR